MRHIKPGESSVMKELEQLASKKGWFVDQIDSDSELTKIVMQKVNSVGALLPSNVSLDYILPVTDKNKLRRAVEIVAHAASNVKINNISKGEYFAMTNMINDTDLNKIYAGLTSLEDMIKKTAGINEEMDFVTEEVKKLLAPYGFRFSPEADSSDIYTNPILIANVERNGYNQQQLKDLADLLLFSLKKGTDSETAKMNFSQLKKMLSKSPEQKVNLSKTVRNIVSPDIIASLQKTLTKATGINVSKNGTPDGKWGPMTARAWNKFIDLFSNYIDFKKVSSSGRQIPPQRDVIAATQWANDPRVQKLFEQTNAQRYQSQPKMKDMVPDINKPKNVKPVKEYNFDKWYAGLAKYIPKFLAMARSLKSEYMKDGSLTTKEKEKIMSIIEGRLIQEGYPLQNQQNVDDNIPFNLVNRKMELPTVTELMNQKPKEEFKPKLPSWMEEEYVPENLVKKVSPQQQQNPTEYAQLNSNQQRYMKSLVQNYMSKGLSENEARKRALPIAQHASTVNELVVLASKLDSMGEVKAAKVVDKQISIYRKAMSQLYNVSGETGDQLIESAHPGGGNVLFETEDDGGRIETIVEEQKKNIEKAMKTPTGKYAFITRQLVSLASRMDKEGKRKASRLIDNAINDIKEEALRPFVIKASLTSENLKLLESLPTLLNNLRDDVQDQSGATENIKTFMVHWPDGRRPNVEYDEFLEYFEDYFKNILNGDNISLLKRNLTSLYNGLNVMKTFYNNAALSFGSFNFDLSNRIQKIILLLFKNNFSKKTVTTTTTTEFNPKKRYRASLKKLDNALKLPLSEDTLLKVLGNGNVEVGLSKKQEFLNWVKSEQKKEYTTIAEYEKNNRDLWTNIIKPLVNKKAIKSISSMIKNIEKTAWDFRTKKKIKPTTKPTSSRRSHPRRKRPQHIINLQAEMLKNNLPIGARKPDGKWGPTTYSSWVKLRAKLQEAGLNDIGEATDPGRGKIGRGPSPQQASNAIKELKNYNALSQYGSRSESNIVHFSFGAFNESVLSNPKTFVQFLQKNGIKADKKSLSEIKAKIDEYIFNFMKKPYSKDVMMIANSSNGNMRLIRSKIEKRLSILKNLSRNLLNQIERSGPPEAFQNNPQKQLQNNTQQRPGQTQQQRPGQTQQRQPTSRYGHPWQQIAEANGFSGIGYVESAFNYVDLLYGLNAMDNLQTMKVWVRKASDYFPSSPTTGKNDFKNIVKYIKWANEKASDFARIIAQRNLRSVSGPKLINYVNKKIAETESIRNQADRYIGVGRS